MQRRKYWISFILMVFLWVSMAAGAAAAPKKKAVPKAQPKETITYVVKKGDSVDKIAKKYDVRADDIARWNNLSNLAHIRIGQKLKIRVPKGSVVQDSKSGNDGTTTITQNISYVVKKGDSLGKISKKTGVSIEDLKKNNKSLQKNPDRLKVGQTLVLRVQKFQGGGSGKSVSRGLANNGALSGGIQLPNGAGYTVRNPTRAYGTASTVELIMDTLGAYAKKYPNGPKFSVGDLSVKNGGRLAPHLSHQSGRDVDISYVRTSDGTKLDIEKNWFAIEKFLKTQKIQYIFMDYDLQQHFYDYARKKGYSDAQLKHMIQYPNGKKSYDAIIRHSKGHSNHFHVRFVCASSDVNCH